LIYLDVESTVLLGSFRHVSASGGINTFRTHQVVVQDAVATVSTRQEGRIFGQFSQGKSGEVGEQPLDFGMNLEVPLQAKQFH
jgi:hypothetical protein